MKNEELPEIVREIGKINFSGNVVPSSWYQTIRLPSGAPDDIAIQILAEIIYWYRPVEVRDQATAQLVGWRKKFRGDKWQISYAALGKKLNRSKETIRKACYRLRDAGLITIDCRIVQTDAGTEPRVTYLAPVPSGVLRATWPDSEPQSGIVRAQENRDSDSSQYLTLGSVIPNVRSRDTARPASDYHITETTTEITTESTYDPDSGNSTSLRSVEFPGATPKNSLEGKDQKKPAAKKETTNPQVQELVATWIDCSKEYHDGACPDSAGRVGALFKRLLAQGLDAEHLERAIDRFFESETDDWLAKTGRTIGAFEARLSALLKPTKAEPKKFPGWQFF